MKREFPLFLLIGFGLSSWAADLPQGVRVIYPKVVRQPVTGASVTEYKVVRVDKDLTPSVHPLAFEGIFNDGASDPGDVLVLSAQHPVLVKHVGTRVKLITARHGVIPLTSDLPTLAIAPWNDDTSFLAMSADGFLRRIGADGGLVKGYVLRTPLPYFDNICNHNHRILRMRKWGRDSVGLITSDTLYVIRALDTSGNQHYETYPLADIDKKQPNYVFGAALDFVADDEGAWISFVESSDPSVGLIYYIDFKTKDLTQVYPLHGSAPQLVFSWSALTTDSDLLALDERTREAILRLGNDLVRIGRTGTRRDTGRGLFNSVRPNGELAWIQTRGDWDSHSAVPLSKPSSSSEAISLQDVVSKQTLDISDATAFLQTLRYYWENPRRKWKDVHTLNSEILVGLVSADYHPLATVIARLLPESELRKFGLTKKGYQLSTTRKDNVKIELSELVQAMFPSCSLKLKENARP